MVVPTNSGNLYDALARAMYFMYMSENNMEGYLHFIRILKKEMKKRRPKKKILESISEKTLTDIYIKTVDNKETVFEAPPNMDENWVRLLQDTANKKYYAI